MIFSSLLFIFLYLPIVLGIYYIAPKKWRNAFLLIANFIFYGWGEPVFVIIMAASIISNYAFGMLIEKYSANKRLKKTFVIFALLISFALLGVFKYAAFFADLLRLIPIFSFLPKFEISLPIGISFYTFQAVSYIIDIYRGDTNAQKSIVNFGTYISFFPQLIAGPIVRYADIETMLTERKENAHQFADGIRLFTVGLSKKVLIANQMGMLWDNLRGISDSAGIVGAWVGIVAYTFQIYFDFSGYSDMACGLGKMFGFEFMKNFDYPYISKSITEFWRRWHISLSTWFRDYVYIPLGGNRCKTSRVIFNLLVVWGLTGLWHGASINFVVWGLYYFILLISEKYIFGNLLKKLPKVIQHIYALIFIIIGWTIFCFDDISEMCNYFGKMFSFNGLISADALSYIISYLPLIIVSVIASTPVGKLIWTKINKKKLSFLAEEILVILALLLCTAALASQSYNPFLYFRF